MRSADTASRYIKRPRGVAQGFQIIKHGVEAQVDEANNVFSKHPSGPQFLDKPAILRPEGAVIFSTQSLPCDAVRLTGESSANNVDWRDSVCGKSFGGERSYVVITGDIGPALSQDGAAVRLDFAEGDCSHSGAFESEAKAADAAEQVKDIHAATTAQSPSMPAKRG